MNERILVVDDQCDIADSLVRLLATLGYQAKAAYNGRDAADDAPGFLPDLVFVDIRMPGFDGYQTVSSIRAHPECAHAIIVALTGAASSEDKQRAFEGGFDLYVAKPMTVDKLMDLLALIDPKASSMSQAGRVYRLASLWGKSKGA